jgi:hypothetical protein
LRQKAPKKVDSGTGKGGVRLDFPTAAEQQKGELGGSKNRRTSGECASG